MGRKGGPQREREKGRDGKREKERGVIAWASTSRAAAWAL